MPRPRFTNALSKQEWLRLSGFGSAVAALHLAGWGLFIYYSGRYPALAGLGVLAYSFGLRHAFDADHIAAIDNTTRKLLQQGKRPLGVGFFFSLGHSTIVFSLAAALTVAARTVRAHFSSFQAYGGTIGASVSGTFLWIIGVLNLLVLLDIVRIYRELKRGEYDEARLEERLQGRGFMNRFFLGRFFARIEQSWQMYPLGVLFGRGFDTATEVGLLAVAAGVASHALRRRPRLASVTLRGLLSAAVAVGCCAGPAAGAGTPGPPVIHELFTLLPCPSGPPKRDSTIGIEGCQEHTIVERDRQIDLLAKAIFVRLGAPATRHQFGAAEAAWLAYRQAFCESESDLFRGGSAAVDEFGACAVSVDEQHVKDLSEFDKALAPH